jgi:hypothetical protein
LTCTTFDDIQFVNNHLSFKLDSFVGGERKQEFMKMAELLKDGPWVVRPFCFGEEGMS